MDHRILKLVDVDGKPLYRLNHCITIEEALVLFNKKLEMMSNNDYRPIAVKNQIVRVQPNRHVSGYTKRKYVQ